MTYFSRMSTRNTDLEPGRESWICPVSLSCFLGLLILCASTLSPLLCLLIRRARVPSQSVIYPQVTLSFNTWKFATKRGLIWPNEQIIAMYNCQFYMSDDILSKNVNEKHWFGTRRGILDLSRLPFLFLGSLLCLHAFALALSPNKKS